jgi:hypothetical protein
MTKWSLIAAPALLLTTALVAAPALAQDATGPVSFALTGSGGVQGFNLPSYDPGAFGHVAGGNLFGGMLSVSGSAKVGDAGDWGVILGINAFGAFGMGSSSWSDSITGPITISGLDPLPLGGTAANTAGATFTATANSPGGGSAHVDNGAGPGPNNLGDVVPDATGFGVAGGAATGTGASAFAGFGDPTGGILVGSSNDGNLVIRTDVSRTVLYGGADLTLGLAGSFDSATTVQVYAGPSIRGLSQGVRTAFTADLTEAPTPPSEAIPTFTIAVNDQLMSTYLGGVFGGNVSFEGTPGVVFTLGAEGGVYTVHSSWNAHDTYSTCCGVDGNGVASQSLSVDGPTHTADLGNAVAFSAKGTASATWALDGNKTVTLGGNVGYLSNVPTVSHSGFVGGTPTTTFGTTSMITYGASVGLTGHF